jgi:hypothetical protein
MADAVIKFPSPIMANQPQGTKKSFAEKFNSIINDAPPESCKSVQSAETLEVLTVPQGLEPVHDFETAGKRNPRWGITLSFSIMPELNRAPVGPVMVPRTQSQFFAADDLEKAKDRVIFEIEKAIKLAKLAAEDPKGYQQYEMNIMQERISSLREFEEGDGK